MSGFNNSLISVTNAQEYGKEIHMDPSGLSYNVIDQKYGRNNMDPSGLSYNVMARIVMARMNIPVTTLMDQMNMLTMDTILRKKKLLQR